MDLKLDDLIEKIKKDGVQQAESQAQSIVSEAEKKAKEIIAQAEKKAADIESAAKDSAAKYQTNANAAIEQALRDSVLVLREKIVTLFDAAFKRKVSDSLQPDFVKELIVKIVDAWSKDTKIELNPAQQQQLTELVFAAVNEDVKKGIEIKTDSSIQNGFRIGTKGNEIFYDFTDEGLSEFLQKYLNISFQ